MKKFFAFMLALVMMCSMSVTAFAATEGTQTITAEVEGVTWTLTIPADVTIPYKQEMTSIGFPTVSDVSDNITTNCTIDVYATWTGVFTSGSDTLPFKLYAGGYEYSARTNENIAWYAYDFITESWGYEHKTSYPGNLSVKIQESDWLSAPQGTYTTTITYSTELVIN